MTEALIDDNRSSSEDPLLNDEPARPGRGARLLQGIKSGLNSLVRPRAVPHEDNPTPHYAGTSGQFDNTQTELHQLQAENRFALKVAAAQVKIREAAVEQRETEAEELRGPAADARLALEAHRAGLRRTREELRGLEESSVPTPDLLAQEEAIRRKLPRLEAQEGELIGSYQAARGALKDASASVDAARGAVTDAVHQLEACQIGNDASEFFVEIWQRALAHQRRGSGIKVDTLVTRILCGDASRGAVAERLARFVRMHREIATERQRKG